MRVYTDSDASEYDAVRYEITDKGYLVLYDDKDGVLAVFAGGAWLHFEAIRPA